jgi:hypothetical protein
LDVMDGRTNNHGMGYLGGTLEGMGKPRVALNRSPL